MPKMGRDGIACPTCGHARNNVMWSDSDDRLPRSLVGLNVTRRTRRCHSCHNLYKTIEMTEIAFDCLRAPAPAGLRPSQSGKTLR